MAGKIFLTLGCISFFLDFHSLHYVKQCYAAAKPVILEPVMLVELKAPTEFQGTVTGDINKSVLHLVIFVITFIILWKLKLVSEGQYGLIS